MVDFLNTASAYSEIESIISKADNRLVLISPYLKIPKLLLERLTYASEERGVNITLVCRKDSLKRQEFKSLKRINRLEILDLPNVHAKCFFNESSMVITSLNLYESSQENNREMGLRITHAEDSEAFMDAMAEAEFIIQRAHPIKINKVLAKETRKQRPIGDVLNTDVGSSLKKAFPTFAKLFDSNKKRDT